MSYYDARDTAGKFKSERTAKGIRKRCECPCKGAIIITEKTILRIGIAKAMKTRFLPGHHTRMKNKNVNWHKEFYYERKEAQ